MSEFVRTLIDLSRAHQDLAYALVFVLAISESLPAMGTVVRRMAISASISALAASGGARLLVSMAGLFSLSSRTDVGTEVGWGGIRVMSHPRSMQTSRADRESMGTDP